MATYTTIEGRRAAAADLLSQRGFVSLVELAEALKVSESTARRDLEVLEDQGLVRRTHGGAVGMRYASGQRLGFADRQTAMLSEKEAIARAVAGLIEDGQTVLMDGGTTCCRVAAALQGRRLSVVTNSIPIASLLFADFTNEVTLVGGYLYPRTGVALGDVAVRQIEGIQASLLVMGCIGLMPGEGVFNINQMIVDVERKMMLSADKVVLVADHGKLGQRGLARLCGAEEPDVIVTDDGVTREHLEWMESLGKKVIVAK